VSTLLIVYHSMTGATQQLAAAAAEGARGETGVQVTLLRAAETDALQVLAARGYLFVTPENLASMSGLMKDFFDRTYYAALERIEGRPYAVIVAAGSDGSGAARQLARIATGWRLREVAPPLIVRNGAQTPTAILAMKQVPDADLAGARELGAALAAGLAAGIF
jgi:multimeric flavodoxin WrbA